MKLEPARALSVLAKIEQSRYRARGLGSFRESVSESFGGYEGLADIRDACDHSVSPQEADARFQVCCRANQTGARAGRILPRVLDSAGSFGRAVSGQGNFTDAVGEADFARAGQFVVRVGAGRHIYSG